jgi:hypothetical protein
MILIAADCVIFKVRMAVEITSNLVALIRKFRRERCLLSAVWLSRTRLTLKVGRRARQ